MGYEDKVISEYLNDGREVVAKAKRIGEIVFWKPFLFGNANFGRRSCSQSGLGSNIRAHPMSYGGRV